MLFLVVGAWNLSGAFQEEYRTVSRHVVDIPDTSDLEWLSVTHIVLVYNLGQVIFWEGLIFDVLGGLIYDIWSRSTPPPPPTLYDYFIFTLWLIIFIAEQQSY